MQYSGEASLVVATAYATNLFLRMNENAQPEWNSLECWETMRWTQLHWTPEQPNIATQMESIRILHFILSNSMNADQIQRNEWICPIPYIHVCTYVYISLEWQSLSQCHIRHTNSLNYPNIICYVNEFQSIHAQFTRKNKATNNIHTYIEMQKKYMEKPKKNTTKWAFNLCQFNECKRNGLWNTHNETQYCRLKIGETD